MAATTAPIARVERLQEAAPAQARGAIGGLLLAALLSASVILFFDWQPAGMVSGTLFGTLAWGAQRYFFETAPRVPRGDVMEAPTGVEVESVEYELSDIPRILFWLVLCVAAVAGLANAWDLGAAVVTGIPAGWALADLVTFIRIRRWERAHGRRVLFDPEAEGADVRPYAGAPL
jgi:hypothetical protein